MFAFLLHSCFEVGPLGEGKTNGDVIPHIDMRTFGKGYEEFYNRIMSEASTSSARHEVVERKGQLLVRTEDTLLGKYREVPVDMVVLMAACQPGQEWCWPRRWRSSAVRMDSSWKRTRTRPLKTATDGIFLCGACQSEGYPIRSPRARVRLRGIVLISAGKVKISDRRSLR